MRRSKLKTLITDVKAAPEGWSSSDVWYIIDEDETVKNLMRGCSGEVTGDDLREQLAEANDENTICEHNVKFYIVIENQNTYAEITNPDGQYAVLTMEPFKRFEDEITIDNLVDNIDEVIEMACTTQAKLSVANHEQGHIHVVIEIDDDNQTVLSAWTAETFDGYYRNTNDNIRSIIVVGTGSTLCNCDACTEGDEPAEWADSWEFWPDYGEEVAEWVRGWKESHAG